MTAAEKRYFYAWRKAMAKVERKYRYLFREALNSEINVLMASWGFFQTPEDVINAASVMVGGNAVRAVQVQLYTVDAIPFAAAAWDDLERERKKEGLSREQWIYQWTQLMEVYVNSEAGLFITSMIDTSRNDVMAIVRRVVEQGTKEGFSSFQIMELLEASLPKQWRKMNVWRSELIARTETITALNYASDVGARSLAEEEGLVLQKKWLVRLDGRERQWHSEMKNVGYIGMNNTFTVGDAKMQRPGDPAGGARNRCNCRCTLIRKVL